MTRIVRNLMGAVVVLATLMASMAQAQNYPPKVPKGPTVEGVQIVRGESLASTGAELRVWMVIALVLLVAGVFTVRAGRRRASRG